MVFHWSLSDNKSFLVSLTLLRILADLNNGAVWMVATRSLISKSLYQSFRRSSFLLLTITRSGRLAEIRWSVCISKSQRTLCVSFSRTDSGLYIYHFFIRSNLDFLHNSQWITFPTKSYLILYFFAQIYCIRLSYDWSFRLYNLIAYIFYFLVSSCFDIVSPYGVV